MPSYLDKLRSDPIGLLERAVYKTTIGPIRYRRPGRTYDAQRYWSDRLGRYGTSLRGVGDEGLNERDNQRMYAQAAEAFLRTCADSGVALDARVLEVGVGAGFYTRLLAQQQPRTLVGVDIADVLFDELRDALPQVTLWRADVTTDRLPRAAFDTVVCIDVIEHIVTDLQMSQAMSNLQNALAPGGSIVLAPVAERGKKHLFYVRSWQLDEIVARFPGFTVSGPFPFRTGGMLVLRRSADD